MAIVTTNDQNYSNIADAIRAKGVNGVFKPSEMADAIASIPTGGGASYVDVTLTQDYTAGPGIISAIQTATGFNEFFAKLISDVPETGACVTAVFTVTVKTETTILWRYLYRRTSTGSWGGANPGTQSAYAGDVFRVLGVE